jgi:hypothetical protein
VQVSGAVATEVCRGCALRSQNPTHPILDISATMFVALFMHWCCLVAAQSAVHWMS